MPITAVGTGILHCDCARVLPANSTTVMPDILYIVLKIHALTAPFLLTFSCMPCQRFIVNELTWAKIRLISCDFEAPWGQQELAGRCLNSKSEQLVLTACLPLIFTAVEMPAPAKNSRLHFWLTLSQTNTSLSFRAWEGASHKHFPTTLSPSIALHSCGYMLYVLTNVALWFSVCVPSFCFHQMPLILNWKLFITKTALSWSPCTSHYMKSPDHEWYCSQGVKTQYSFLRERFALYKCTIKFPYNKFKEVLVKIFSPVIRQR